MAAAAAVFLIVVYWLGNDRPAAILTHENYLAQLNTQLDLDNIAAVFDYVFSALPEEVKVFPTENYYYFKFYADGKEIWGNVRLSALDRDEGKLHFAYWEFNNLPERQNDHEYISEYKLFGPDDGLRMKKQTSFSYAVSWRGKTVVFNLNEISQEPNASAIRDDEKFLMRTFDESGLIFNLIFRENDNNFMWVLDEKNNIPEEFMDLGEGLFLGKRTQFAFYDDGSPPPSLTSARQGRKILVGVYAGNIRRNNYFDGPFDQLADNFITGEGLRPYIERAYPTTRGEVDEYGYFLESDGSRASRRVAIAPYYTYLSERNLLDFMNKCQKSERDEELITCLTDE